MTQKIDRSPSSRNSIGLIVGLAMRAGVFYYEQIVQHFSDRGESPELILRHADVKKVLDLVSTSSKAELARYLGSLANELADAGACFFAVTAVAPHLAIEEISHVSRIPVVSVLDTLSKGMRTAGLDKVAVFGNRAVLQTNVFGALREEQAVKLDQSMMDEIHAIYTDIALSGKRGTSPERGRLNDLAHELIELQGASAIVLAGTDLSSFYADQKPDFPYLDMAQMHIEQMMDFSMSMQDR